MRSAIVIGVGPINGLGGQLAIRFAKRDLEVFVAGRTQASVEAVVEQIERADGRANGVVTDATQEDQLAHLFELATSSHRLDLAIYNVGNNTPGRIVDIEPSYFEHSWRTVCFGGFLFGREAVKRMTPGGGTILYTGASASLRGRANFGAFNSSKGAVRLLAQAMAKEYAADGIHVGHVVIDGPIGGDKIIHGIPEYAERIGEAGLIDLEGIVDAYEFMYDQPPRAWTFEVDVRTSTEKW